MNRKITLVIPVYRSAKFLHKTIKAVDDQRKESNWDLEVILVEDGSPDNSFEIVEKLSKEYSYIKGIKLSRNFGHQIAVKTGLHYATGDYIAIIDDDLQDPPSLLPRFFSQLDMGYEVAYGVRKKRKEGKIKKLAYNSFYRLLDSISETKIPLDSGDFCVMTKNVKDKMLTLNEQNPYLRGIRAWVGFKQIGLEYERSGRIEGESGYSLKKLIKIAKDGIFSFSSLPLQIISLLGNFGLFISVVFTLFTVIRYFSDEIEVAGYTTIIIMMLFFNSILLISLGIIGEYIYRIYNEVRNRPYTIIEKTINT
ncbi:glycosyltransferase involved in cell wall biosynthesis [Chryseobacterium ginsenosidimutans]|uniref:glycosyltransferase family 2 protein n=1 Tax=Chryseobacterium ginsenosidimutans TaxID=687846 RepID=UPI00278A2694|nr:glycosyltransferase family 2 protein [Chryseobacterium ginsenosidimutans]MDQ0591907.1 glycosyltransferase involved in cell wall biosynthesis [Chryseobacterium ginsenosidimutans]